MGLRPLFVAVFALLAGCGFQPMYGELSPSAETEAQLNDVDLIIEETRLGSLLQNEMADAMYTAGAPDNPNYVLSINLRWYERGTALRIDASTAREIFELRADFELAEMQSGKVVYRGNRTTSASYDVVDSQFATLVSKEDAQSRAVRQLSEDIQVDLSFHFADPRELKEKVEVDDEPVYEEIDLIAE